MGCTCESLAGGVSAVLTWLMSTQEMSSKG